MKYEILKGDTKEAFAGCDFVLKLPEDRVSTEIRILQITDTQIIDSTQCRTPDRLRPDEIAAWTPDRFDGQCGNHIRSLITQAHPDLIIMTGDIIYGSFDDKGTTFDWFCELMDGFKIPWAPVFGNHDNESKMGLDWQCRRLEESEYCIFKRGEVSGNSNYTVGIAVGEHLVRVLYMIDSNGCAGSSAPGIIRTAGIYPDQIALMKECADKIRAAQKRTPPAFMAFHIPIDCFELAEREKGYRTEGRDTYIIGVDTPALDGDFGFMLEPYRTIKTEEGFIDLIREMGVEGVFVGHAHNNNFSIEYRGVKWVFGLKTGQYDYHLLGQLGGTLITLNGDDFYVRHVPSLVRYAPMPAKAKMFENFFTE